MKQREKCVVCDRDSITNRSDDCEKSFERINKYKNRQCSIENRLRNCKSQSDKLKRKYMQRLQMNNYNNRSQRCLEHNTVQSSLVNALTNFKFAFHGIILIVVFLPFVICSEVVNGQQQAASLHSHSADISNLYKTHSVIQPTIFDGVNQRKILTSTRQTNGEHAQHIVLEYTHLDKPIVADLFLNRQLLPERHFLSSQNSDGSKYVQRFNRSNSDLCHYQGHIRNNPKSKVALSTCDGINGYVYDGDDTHFIRPNEVGVLHKSHNLYSQSQMNELHPIVRNSIYDEPATINEEPKKKVKRSVTDDTVVREPYNANKQSSFVELVIVVDHEVYKRMDENLDKVHKYCKDIANIINSLYVPLNIFITLVGVVVWNESNQIELSTDGDATLKAFLNYRRKELIIDHPNDNAQLLTEVQFEGGVVGKALKGPICTFEFSGGVSTYHSPIVSVVATTIAHEMGHNFGMEHDTADCKCDDDKCIMSASSSSIAPTKWSECSIHQLNLAIHQGMNHCLRNVPKHLFDSPTCGNGFVENGEECDCGLPSVCKNTCCDPNTCKLYSNATCATGKCCDLATCQYHEPGFECRSSAGECDLPEYCDGNSEFCPIDYFKRDTEECEGGKAFCYNGSCKSRDDQCKLLWGPSGKSSELCYEKNLDGSRHGNCGYNRSANVYKSCTKEDIFCGMLQCRHLNERLEFGLESVAVLSHSFITYGGNVIPCRTAVIDLGIETVDPGLAPDGSKCDDGKMCISQKCISIDQLRKEEKVKDCQNDCNKHGTCDNMGHCHCEKGFAPPNCDSPGPGGSLHSGPAQNPNDGYGIVRVLYVFFLGVVPFISLSLLFFYYWRQNRPWFISQMGNELKISVRHHPDRPAPPPPPPLSTPALSPSSTDDMNATLLKPNNQETMKRELFGNFKGFSLKPLPMSKPNIFGAANVAYVHPVVAKTETVSEQCVPNRAAPLPPPPQSSNATASPKKSHPIKSSPVSHSKSSPSAIRYQNIDVIDKSSPETPIEVKLFASKSDAKERPKISHPILENSTCSVKDLISTSNANQSVQFKSNVLPKTNVAQRANELQSALNKNPIDKSSLKRLDLSSSEKSERPNSFGRSQSMRSPSSVKDPPKRNVQASGSMRYPGGLKRVATMNRPKNPPPPRPPNAAAGTASSTADSMRNIYANTNDSRSLENSTDNIYCDIDDIKDRTPPNGLLSEIVNEIESRNLNSIYSTSTKSASNSTIKSNRYENTNKIFDTHENSTEPSQSSGSENSQIYMNAAAAEQPLIRHFSGNKDNKAQKSNVATMAKKLTLNAAPGNSTKPIIAAKPPIVEQKNINTSNKIASPNASAKRPNGLNATKLNAPNMNKTNANPVSTVRSMQKRFENRKA